MPYDEREAALRRFFGEEEDEGERHLRLLLERIERDEGAAYLERQEQERQWITAALATIGTDLPEPELPAHMQRRAPHRRQLPIELIDPRNDPDVIWDEPERTPYDRAFVACRGLEAEFAGMKARESLTEAERLRVIQLPGLIEQARQRMKLEIDRDGDPVWRERHAIDAHRKTEDGKAERRNVRATANAGYEDLSDLTEAEKKVREDEQKYVSNLRKRLEKSGMDETGIEAKIAKDRVRWRAKHAVASDVPADTAMLIAV